MNPRDRLRIVFLSHTAPNAHLVVGSHHLAREMSRAGHDVAHVAAPISLIHVTRIRDETTRSRLVASLRPPREDADGVLQAVPLTIVPVRYSPSKLREIELSFPRSWNSGLLNRFRRPDIVFVDQPLLVEFAARLAPRLLIYRPTDAHFDNHVRSAEVATIKASDAVVATSSSVLDEVTAGTGWRGPTMVLENGVDHEHFAPRGPTSRSGFVYVGAVDRRFDWKTIKALADAFPAEPMEIFGPVTSAPSSLPNNVRLHGPIDYALVPSRLHKFKVGLLPLSPDRGNEGRSPMKYYEYLAAGLNVLARQSPTLVSRSAPGVGLYANDREAIERARELLAGATSGNDQGIEAARIFGWPQRSRTLLEFVGGLG